MIFVAIKVHKKLHVANILDLVYECNTDFNQVFVSSITPRNDTLRQKAQVVNTLLQSECNDRNIGFINNNNINITKHLNGSRLHLNQLGTGILANHFINFMKSAEN